MTEILELHKHNSSLKIGEFANCPVCGKLFKKKTKTHSFCSNGRTKKGGNCKDKFWNIVDERKARWEAKDFEYVDHHRNIKKVTYL